MQKYIVIFMMILMTSVRAMSADPAIVFVNQVTDTVIDEVITSQKSQDEKLALFQKEFNEALDLKNIGQFVLGIYWKKATPDQREAFLEQFRLFTTKTWLDRFNLYDGQSFVFSGARNAERGQLFVDSSVQMNPPVEVVWRLRQKDGAYKIIDIIVEGVSMAMSYRTEYSAFLQKNGGDLSKLIDTLKEKNDTFVFTKKAAKKA